MNDEPETSGRTGSYQPSPRRDGPNMLWVIALHSAAVRRWLAQDPPKLDEAAGTLRLIEQASHNCPSLKAAAEDAKKILYRACA